MEQTIGTCSICGGAVRTYSGAWMSVLPPPPPTCSQCGAQAATHGPVVPMVPSQSVPNTDRIAISDRTAGKGWW